MIKNSIKSGKQYNTLENRIIKYKPAVTRVDEWTKEEIGVGADIDAGSQGEKGKRADLVINPTNKTGTKKKNRPW